MITWDGITYNSSTANTDYLELNNGGTLADVSFGTLCSGGTPCGVGAGVETWSVEGSAAGNGFGYGTPEPSTLALLGLGLAGTLLIRDAGTLAALVTDLRRKLPADNDPV